MSNTTTTIDSEDGINNETPAAAADDDIDNGCRGKNKGYVLKKGPWTSAEDGILTNYVNEHGPGNWNAVEKNTVLRRCGKSCRLRWFNHLRPNLKTGPFSKDEEQKVAEMHAKMGNKWAKMAEQLPGRTDNVIKNYWNTHKRRQLRNRLPLYPPQIRVDNFHRSREYANIAEDSRRHQDLLQLGNSKFNGLNFATRMLPEASDLSAMLGTGASSMPMSYRPTFLFPSNQILESLSRCSSIMKHQFQSPEDYQHTDTQKNPGSCIMSPCDVDQYSSDGISNPSFGAVKLELPSFQKSGTCYLLPWKLPPLSDLIDSADDSSCDTALLELIKSSGQSSFNSTTCATDATQNVAHGGVFEDCQKNIAGGISSGNVVNPEESSQIWEPTRVDVTQPNVLLDSIGLDQGRFATFSGSSSMRDAFIGGCNDIEDYFRAVGSSSSQATRGVESFKMPYFRSV